MRGDAGRSHLQRHEDGRVAAQRAHHREQRAEYEHEQAAARSCVHKGALVTGAGVLVRICDDAGHVRERVHCKAKDERGDDSTATAGMMTIVTDDAMFERQTRE